MAECRTGGTRRGRLGGDGLPNVVRGGSHLGWTSAARIAEAGICSVLSSGYLDLAMLRVAMVLAGAACSICRAHRD